MYTQKAGSCEFNIFEGSSPTRGVSINPHMYTLAADGCFGKDGYFYASPINIDTESLEKLFIHKIFKMLLSKGLISERIIESILSWVFDSLVILKTFCKFKSNNVRIARA
ncbi:MAG: hypothetical protein H8E13_14420 [Actinobacteria bacterium]|nr:hypothetical protein [Actinomycetota bacterium]